MKKLVLVLILMFSCFLVAQEEVHLAISEGMPVIPVALPEFQYTQLSTQDDALLKEIYDTVWDDLQYSRVFKLIPKEHFDYISKFDINNIIFNDWASLQAKFLLAGELEISAEKRIILSVKMYDVNNGKFLFGRNFGGKQELVRLIGHRVADEMMNYFGEKPYFTSKIVFVSDREGNKEIFLMDYDGKRQSRLTFNDTIDILPSWSNDSEKILYTSYRKGGPDLFMFHLYTGKTDLISTGGVNYSADWAFDENKIVYTSSKKGNAEIYNRDMESGREKRVTFNQAIDTTPCWSPNGKEIAFVSQRTGIPRIYIMSAEGTNVRCITSGGTHFDSPSWSPDGTRIAYVSMVEGRLDIYVHNLKSNSITKLTEKAGRNENPTWSPDGRHIVFSSNRTGGYQLYTVDYDGRNLKRLTASGENKMPRWQKK